MSELEHRRQSPGEVLSSDEEDFMPIESVRALLLASLSDRIDDLGCVKPVTVVDSLTFDATTGKEYIRGVQSYHDVAGLLIPDGKVSNVADLSGNTYYRRPSRRERVSLYNILTDCNSTRKLSAQEISQLELDEAALVRCVSKSGVYDCKKSAEQTQDAYHIYRNVRSYPDFSAVRVYVHSDIRAMGIAERVLKTSGVSCDYVKCWIPTIYAEEYCRARSDAPIFETSTYADLEGIISALRSVYQERTADIVSSDTAPLLGMPVPNMPGVYIAQCKRGTSFNGVTSRYLEEAFDQAVRECNLETGQVVTEEWLDAVARQARQYAQQGALKNGYDPTNHAFLVGEEDVKSFTESICRRG